MEKNKPSYNGIKLSPAMERYVEIKEQHQDYLIFYRMGDFYELFFEDAEVASRALGIALTQRGKADGKDIPMCGVPFHSCDGYISRLIRQGYKVAICEQVETPEQAKQRGSGAILKREVVRLVTSGTLTEDGLLDARKNNFLICCVQRGDKLGFSWIDLSTAEFFTQSVMTSEQTLATDIASVLGRLDPVEIIISDTMQQKPNLYQLLSLYRDKLTPMPQARFNNINAQKLLESTFKVQTLDAFGSFSKAEITAAGIIIDYIQTTQKGNIPRIKPPVKFNDLSYMEIDNATRHNLELTYSVNGDRNQSLLHVIDRTITGAGSRMLANRISSPSTDLDEINRRLDILSFFIDIPEIRNTLRDYLKNCSDLERCISRLSINKTTPKELFQIRRTLEYIPKIRNLIFAYGRYKKMINGLPSPLEKLLNSFGEFSAITTRIADALKNEEELPNKTSDGAFIRDGYSPSLDMLRETHKHGTANIRQMEAKYIEQTKIANLKVRYNNILGYFIEVPTKFATELFNNPDFIHRQSILSAARFTTVELNEAEQQASTAGERALALELELYNSLLQDVLALADDISRTAAVIAELDISSALADLAVNEQYCRPTLDHSLNFDIKDGRHPVVEAALAYAHEGDFIGNDCCLNADNNRVWLLTGPNMAGKSTFLRQNAIIAIMAQIGSYVPCQSATIGIIDKIFSRVGASDDLSRGRSTFMVEMVETAAILNQATERSFVILDEIGRGTATYDGLSIAWSVVEHLHEVNRCRSLFATHYHELTALDSKLDALSLHCMKIKEFNDEIIFMHEVINGTADRSYGIHVARLAGIPELVLKRADQILQSLEENSLNRGDITIENDLPLFSVFKQEYQKKEKSSPLMNTLKNLNPDNLSPREALEKLYELKNLAEQEKSR